MLPKLVLNNTKIMFKKCLTIALVNDNLIKEKITNNITSKRNKKKNNKINVIIFEIFMKHKRGTKYCIYS